LANGDKVVTKKFVQIKKMANPEPANNGEITVNIVNCFINLQLMKVTAKVCVRDLNTLLARRTKLNFQITDD
jgi:hypothetical protein